MSDTPLVTVIMPLYNKRLYVNNAIDSVRNQTFTDWELIIVDDGSTDGSSDNISLEDKRIRLFFQKNSGPSVARNHGMKMARGEFITFLDADDYYYSNKLECELSFLENNTEVDWMASAFEYEVNNQLRIFSFRDVAGNVIKDKPCVFNNALLNLTIKGWHICGICIKKCLLQQVGGFRETMRWKEITDFQIRCALARPKILIYPFPLFRVVDVSESASKIYTHRIDGIRQMGETLHSLGNECVQMSDVLFRESKKDLYSYIAALINSGRANAAREYLTRAFPYSKDTRWWKMWLSTWAPASLVRLYHSTRAQKN